MTVSHVEVLVEEPSMEAARAIAPHMNPVRNRSRSFQLLYKTLAEMEK